MFFTIKPKRNAVNVICLRFYFLKTSNLQTGLVQWQICDFLNGGCLNGRKKKNVKASLTGQVF